MPRPESGAEHPKLGPAWSRLRESRSRTEVVYFNFNVLLPLADKVDVPEIEPPALALDPDELPDPLPETEPEPDVVDEALVPPDPLPPVPIVLPLA